MPRNLEDKLASFRVAQARRAEGRPPWDYTVHLGPALHTEGGYEAVRDALVAALRASQWIRDHGSDGGPLDRLVDELAETIDREEGDEVLNEIARYAEAEECRAFLDPTTTS